MSVPSAARLRAEFTALFVVVPIGGALVLPPDALFPALFALAAVGLFLLSRTPGFRWRGLLDGRVSWPWVAAFVALSAAISVTLVLTQRPEAWLMPGRASPGLLVAIFLLYPLLSALPQELVYRPLFFDRYASILPGGWGGIVLNATLFSLAHLMFWNWIAVAMTFFGGLAFAHSYRMRGSFPEAFVLHALVGNLLFAIGMGAWFYSGNVVRPF